MADKKQRKVIKNLRSNDVVDGKPKLPTAEQLNFGEIAVNYAQDNEILLIKNDDNQIVEFSNKVSSDYAKTVYPTPFEKIVSDNDLHIKGGDQLNSVAVKKIESTISSLANEVIENAGTQSEVAKKLAEGSGLLKTDGSIGFEKKENTNYIKNASSIYDALIILDAKIKEINVINNDVHLILIATGSNYHDKALIPLKINKLGVNDSVVWSHDLANDIATIDGTTLRFLKHYEGTLNIKATAGAYTDEKTITIKCIQVPDTVTYKIATQPPQKTVNWNDTSTELSFKGKIVGSYSDGHKPSEETTSTYTFEATFPQNPAGSLPEVNKEYVDLGLPSGNLWAKCNLYAQKETDYGYYFQWGDTDGYPTAGVTTITRNGTYTWEGQEVAWTVQQKNQVTKSFNWDSYKYYNSSTTILTKYNTITSQDTKPDNKTVLELMDDAVYQIMGQGWSMPTKADFEELLNNTNKSWTTINGVNGYKFAKKDDADVYIFIPAAGCGGSSSVSNVGSNGYVWSSSLFTSYPNYAWFLYFGSGSCHMDNINRYDGLSVRGVCKK